MNIFERKLTLIANVFLKLWTPKNVVRSMSKKSCFRGPFKKQDYKLAQILLKFEQQCLYHIYWLQGGQLSLINSLLLLCKFLRLFVNTLTADNKYSFLNRDNLTQPIQMQLSQKQNFFSEFFANLLKASLNFEHFQKKDDPHSWCISEITDSEKRS